MKITPNDPKSVGQRIRNIRQILGDSMEQFAKKIDDKAKSGTVSNWETGKNLPNSKRLKRIAELGNVTVDYLLGKYDASQDIETKKELDRIWINFIYRKGVKKDPEIPRKSLQLLASVCQDNRTNFDEDLFNKMYDIALTLNPVTYFENLSKKSVMKISDD